MIFLLVHLMNPLVITELEKSIGSWKALLCLYIDINLARSNFSVIFKQGLYFMPESCKILFMANLHYSHKIYILCQPGKITRQKIEGFC